MKNLPAQFITTKLKTFNVFFFVLDQSYEMELHKNHMLDKIEIYDRKILQLLLHTHASELKSASFFFFSNWLVCVTWVIHRIKSEKKHNCLFTKESVQKQLLHVFFALCDDNSYADHFPVDWLIAFLFHWKKSNSKIMGEFKRD